MSVHESTRLRESAYRSYLDGRLEEALSQLRALMASAGADLQLCNDMAVVAFRLGYFDEAVGYFRAAQRMCSDREDLLVVNLIDALETLARSTGTNTQEVVEPQGNPLPRWLEDSASKLHADAAQLTDEHWANVIFDSVAGKSFNGHMLPAFIDEDMQRTFVGSSGVGALIEAHRFIKVMLGQLGKHGLNFAEDSVAVDFGCGWGRYTRFMLKYIHPDNFYGFDVNSKMVEHCRKAFGMANFMKVGTMPPSPLRDGMVDLVFGYSVFSHLAPHCADAWITEFSRITRPGAIVIMTTQARGFINFCSEIRRSGNLSNPWYEALATSFVNSDQALQDYDRGNFVHAGHGQYDGTYGESLIPRGYIEEAWCSDFELVDFIDDPSVLPQALFVLKRR